MGIDATTTPIPVRPAVHYTMGGILVDIRTASPLPGLYCGRRMLQRRHPRRQPARIELARRTLGVRPRRRRAGGRQFASGSGRAEPPDQAGGG